MEKWNPGMIAVGSERILRIRAKTAFLIVKNLFKPIIPLFTLG